VVADYFATGSATYRSNLDGRSEIDRYPYRIKKEAGLNQPLEIR